MSIKDKLQMFGLSKIDADVYYEVLKYPNSNGTQISKKIDAARTSIYKSLEKLNELGYIYKIPSIDEKKSYIAENPKLVVEKIKEKYLELANQLKEELSNIEVKSAINQVISIEKEEIIFDKISSLISESKNKILILSNIELDYINYCISKNKKKEVEIDFINIEIGVNGKMLIVSDDKNAIIIEKNDSEELLAFYTENKLFIDITSHYILNYKK